jgi:NADH-quinone oxidoreductase subunit C
MHNEIVSFINSKVAGANATAHIAEVGDSSVTVDGSKIKEVCLALRDSSEFELHTLQVITGTDYSDRIEVSYVLASYTKNLELILKVKLPKASKDATPAVESVVSVWSSANFQERECYDMIGVIFNNHPDFRRILCPEDWEGFPLRKDYVVQEVYNGMTVNPAHKINTGDQFFMKKVREAAADPSIITGSWESKKGSTADA